MFIQTEPTPNPATLKFLPGRTVLASGTLDMRDPEPPPNRHSPRACLRSLAFPAYSSAPISSP